MCMNNRMKALIVGAVTAGIFTVTKKKQEVARHHALHVPYGPYEAVIKRLLDVLLSGAALVVFSPVLIVTAFLVRVKLGPPVLFRQNRPGINGKIFKIYKFRTMTDQYDSKGKLLPDEARMTLFGMKLRSTSIDELPELINILKGDMSVVGPRPLLTNYLPYYTAEEMHRHDVRPGLTGLAQINGRNLLGWDERFRKDIEYINKVSFLNDLAIVCITIKKVLRRSDVLEDTSKGETNFALERMQGKI